MIALTTYDEALEAFRSRHDNTKVSYVPLPRKALIGRLRRDTHETITGLEGVLPQIGHALAARVVQHLAGLGEVTERTVDVIESARATLWLSIWPDESSEYVGPVAQAIARGVDVFTIAYGNVGPIGGRVYIHSYSSPDVVLERIGCRISIAVADHQQALIAGVTSSDVWGVWSDDRAVALLAAEHVRHDIALQITAEHLEAAGLSSFWENNPDLEALRDASAAAVVRAF